MASTELGGIEWVQGESEIGEEGGWSARQPIDGTLLYLSVTKTPQGGKYAWVFLYEDGFMPLLGEGKIYGVADTAEEAKAEVERACMAYFSA
jgi:hypothetical protein